MLGPIDYIVVGFVGNNFDGSVLEELKKAAENGIIRVVDLLFVIKDEDGNVTMAEIEDQHEELKEVAKAIGHEGDLPLLSEDDVEKLGAKMDNDTSAGVLVIEHLWAKGLKTALIDAGAFLIDEGRIHPDTIAVAIEAIEEEK
jgi:rRNA maturation endonuclease Nob1